MRKRERYSDSEIGERERKKKKGRVGLGVWIRVFL